jgi:protein-S-isoprenylcysteine O-methyltransferase Ste14
MAQATLHRQAPARPFLQSELRKFALRSGISVTFRQLLRIEKKRFRGGAYPPAVDGFSTANNDSAIRLPMLRALTLAYAAACYALFGVVSVWAMAFWGNFGLRDTIDAPATGNVTTSTAINALLVAVFGFQHSVMARPWFKRWWTSFIPQPAERSTYLLFSCLALGLLLWQWQPMGGVIWDVQPPVARGLIFAVYLGGWLTIVAVSHMINHYDLFGLRQAWLHFQGRPYESLPFATPGAYRWVRHPLYIGWLMVFWAAPTMTWSHLLLAVGMTAYILIAIPLEERDLIAHFGEKYLAYRRQVPALFPRVVPAASKPDVATSSVP